MFRCPRARSLLSARPGGGGMADDSDAPPLPRRVPGASASARPPVQVERPVIPEDLRQRVLTAIADELQRDEAEEHRRAREHGKSRVRATSGERDGAPRRDAAQDKGPEQAGEPVAQGAAPEQAASQAAAPTAPVPSPPVAGEQTADPPAVPLPRRAPGAKGDRLPPARVRRVFLPPSLLARGHDSEAHTEPLPRIPGYRAHNPPATDGPHHAEDPAAAPTLPTGAPPPVPAPADSAPPGSGEAGAAPPDRPLSGSGPRGAGPPGPGPELGAEPSGPGPDPDAGQSGAGDADPGMPLSAPPLLAAPPAVPVFPARVAPPDFRLIPPPSAVRASLVSPVAPPLARPTPPAAPAAPVSAPPPGSSWPPDRNGKQPGNGAVVPAPPAPPAGQKQWRPGRRYRAAGLIVAVIALAATGAVALVLFGRAGTAGTSEGGPQLPGAGAGVRNVAAAWVASQISRTAVVACDPVMCQALRAHGVPPRDVYPLGPEVSGLLHSEVIVATAQLRHRFGNQLSSVYAPAILASFGSGPQRIDVRETAAHGAAAYRAMLSADLRRRKVSGAELLHSNRIAVTPIARRELSAGRVDPRLLVAIAQMASVRPMYIINFGSAAPGADPDLPLRFADLRKTGHAHRHSGWPAGYLRSVVLFLHAQRSPLRAARVETVYLAGGRKALRIEFPAPSPLGPLAPRRT